MPTYRLTVEYEGTRYHGWQEQHNARTVAGVLRRALEEVAGPIADLCGAGRTDAGVHALAQTAHLRLRSSKDPDVLCQEVNDRLPPDVHLLAALQVPESFHARHAALARSYLYQISRRRTALAKRFVWWVKRPLDAERMAAAASTLVGRHDFRHFCERPGEQSSTIVVVESVEVATAGSLVLVRFVASHFLWKMVRRIVGALVEVGSGDLPPRALEELCEGNREASVHGRPAEWTAPPSGLFLERVVYEGEPALGALAPAGPVPPEEPFAASAAGALRSPFPRSLPRRRTGRRARRPAKGGR